ncbi:family 78 glycoside hydrolase catalytic domain [Pedobacter sp. P351]|uniref:family 78 glycoside hydrolase catalytic domain n=1 Tax=Pedobacter superstes TaxID=3133441 RepID=UPI0030B35CB6
MNVVCLFVGTLPFLVNAAAPKAPSNLRSCDKVNPVGTDSNPYFGWYINDADNNEVQTAYQVIVASSPNNLNSNKGDIWDSGKTASGIQNYIYFGGKSLLSAHAYYWKVRTWDKDGNVSPYSSPSMFNTGLFTSADWSGSKWIKRTSNDADDYTYYRKSFNLDKKVKRAIAYAAVSHNYELFTNGKFIAKASSNHYPQYAYYQAFDITPALKPGRNTLASFTHWYGGGQGRATGSRGFLMKTIIEYTDGSSITIGTDNTWKQTKVETWITPQPRRNGEGNGYIDFMDSRKMIANWNQTGYDDSAWSQAIEIGAPPVAPWTGELQPDLTRIIENEVKPVSVKSLGKGRYLIDLGKIYAGMPKINFAGGKSGDTVTIRGAYILNEDGTASANRGNQSTNLAYYFILNGNKAVFNPMNYLAYRYIQVDHSPNALNVDNVRFISRHFELEPSRAQFSSSNPMLNRVWDLMIHSLIAGAHEGFVDTPTREKGAFLGDGGYQGPPAMSTMGERSLNQRILLEFLDSQDQYWPDGRLNAVYPNVDGKRDIPDYTQAYLVWVWDYFMQTGNAEFLKANYRKLRKVAEYVDTYKNPATGLIHKLAGGGGAYQYGIIDWPTQMRYGYDMSVESRTVVDALAYLDFDIISKIADVLGNSADKELYRSKAEAMKSSMNSRLINQQGVYIDGLKADQSQSAHVSQHANMFPLAIGIVPEKNKKTVIDAIKERKMSVGMVTIRYLPQAIGEAGEAAHLLELYTNSTWDGWAKTVAAGGTVTWESWDADKHNESMSHPWGAIGLFGIQQYILGLKSLKPQHELIEIRPLDFEGKLSQANGTFPSDKGDIKLDWNRDNKRFLMTLIMPANVKAKVYVPKSGTEGAKLKVDGVEINAAENGNYLFIDNIGSGKHTFERLVKP